MFQTCLDTFEIFFTMESNYPPLTEIETANFKNWLVSAPDYRHNREFQSQGWEEEQVVWKKESEMLCAICRTFPRRAFILPCGHYFCQRCLKEWFFQVENRKFTSTGLLTRPCPYCRQPFSRPDINIKSLDDFTGTVLLKCVNTDCDIELPPVAMRFHELIYCEKRMINCPSRYCDERCKLEEALAALRQVPASVYLLRQLRSSLRGGQYGPQLRQGPAV